MAADRSGLLRLLTPDEAVVARHEARQDFAARFRNAMGYECPVADLSRWYGG